MKCAIVYESLTGNTERLAEKIHDVLRDSCMYYGKPSEEAKKADLILVGFWTDKGNCPEKVGLFLKELDHKKVFLFGTAGFGGQSTYFEQILDTVKKNLPKGNTVIGEFMCQGKMPVGVRKRYEAMLLNTPDDEHLKGMIKNFDNAMSHPDKQDFDNLIQTLEHSLNNIR